MFASRQARARFEREIGAAATLEHPNIVTACGSELIDDQLVLAMQWIDGRPFDEWAEAVGRAPRRVLDVFSMICDAVQHAHQRGVIHRDLKPSNILVDADHGPHVLDFGLAKIEQPGVSLETLTHTNAFFGTPAFAAPEQFAGDAAEPDIRTDVYALGAVLYRALTGVEMFDATRGIAHVIDLVRHTDPVPPSTHNRALNPEIDAIILRAVARRNDDRYASVHALREDIRRYLAGEPVLAHAPSMTYRLRKLARRYWISFGGAIAFVAMLIAATVVSTKLYVDAVAERDMLRAVAIHRDFYNLPLHLLSVSPLVAEFYEEWDAAEPGRGHDRIAEEWWSAVTP